MAKIPVQSSYNQILGRNIAGFLSRYGLKALKVGSPILSTLEAVSQSQVRVTQDIFNILNSVNLDFATGQQLDQIGLDEGVPRITETPSSTDVTISDSSFSKRSTKVYSGKPAPITGTTTLYVESAAGWPNSGQIYIGRGSENYEGPITYSSITPIPGVDPSYYSIALSSNTLKFHNHGESVILAQGGNRTIQAGTIIQTTASGFQSTIKFRTLYQAAIPDGEISIEGVIAVAIVPGVTGNVPAKAINSFSTAPFSGATVLNTQPLANGLPTEDDDTYRERIRSIRNSRQKGTPLAITTSAIGITAIDENKRIQSASLVNGNPGFLYIDDGSGYEEKTLNVPFEIIMDSADGGEDTFELVNRPVAKAFLISTQSAPFALFPGAFLTFKVNGATSVHTFDSADFNSISSADAFEIVSSINSNPYLNWSARTANSGTQVVVFPKGNDDDDILYVASNGDANNVMQFSSTQADTLKLYKNDRLLYKDGRTASIQSKGVGSWSSFTGDQSLVINVDGIILNFDTSTIIGDGKLGKFTAIDFVITQTGFSSVANNTAEAWAKVFNLRIPGITATVYNSIITLTSNKGKSSDAYVEIVGGSLVSNGMFLLSNSVGIQNDYTLNRNLSQIVLNTQLTTGDTLTAGTNWPRGFIQSSTINQFNITSLANSWWFLDDQEATNILEPTSASKLLNVTDQEGAFWGTRLRIATADGSSIFSDIQRSDWVVVWDGQAPKLQGAHRISRVDTDGKWFEIERPSQRYSRWGHAAVTLQNGNILVIGGNTAPVGGSPYSGSLYNLTNSVELYSPTNQTWYTLTPMSIGRVWHTATLMADGKVIVIGGKIWDGTPTDIVEVFDSSAGALIDTGVNMGTWTTKQPITTARVFHTATLRSNNEILVVGGWTGTTASTTTNAVHSYSPGSDLWSAFGNISSKRAFHTATYMSTSTDILIVGGEDDTGLVLDSADRWFESTDTWNNVAVPAMGATQERTRHDSILLNNGNVLVVGGDSNPSTGPISEKSSVLYYSPSGNSWTTTAALPDSISRFKMAKTNNNSIALGANGLNLNDFSGYIWTGIASTVPSNRWFTTNVAGTSSNSVVSTGGFDGVNLSGEGNRGLPPWARFSAISLTTPTTPVKLSVDPAITTGLSLTSNGIAFIRSNSYVLHTVVPVANNYTVPTLVSSLSSTLVSARAKTYKTTSARVYTSTHQGGAVLLGTADLQAQKFNLPIAEREDSLMGQNASVLSQSIIGTPNFTEVYVRGTVSATDFSVHQNYFNRESTTISANSLVGSGQLIVGDVNQSTTSTLLRHGDQKGFYSPIVSVTQDSQLVIGEGYHNKTDQIVSLRTAPEQLLKPYDRIYVANPYQITPSDQLSVVVDQDTDTKSYNVNMWRTLKTVGSTYANTNTFKDADNNNLSLTATFGSLANTPFYFDDFAVFMPARVKTHPADSTKSILWRFYRLGPEGNNVQMKYSYPATANSLATQTWAYPTSGVGAGSLIVSVSLKSGAAKTDTDVQNTSIIGTVCPNTSSGFYNAYYILSYPVASAQRITNDTYLTLSLPSGMTDHGFIIGDQLNLVSTDPAFTSGVKTITYRTSTVVGYADPGVNIGPNSNIGYLNLGNQTLKLGASTTQYDFFRLGASSNLPVEFEEQTARIQNNPASSPYWIQVKLETFTGSVGFYSDTVTAGNIVRVNGVTTATFSTPHQFKPNDRFTLGGTLETPGPLIVPGVYTVFDTPTAYTITYLEPSFVDSVSALSHSFTRIINYSAIGDAGAFNIFSNANTTAAQIVTDISASATTLPLSPILVGDGTGLISLSSAEESGTNPTFYSLSDGINYVKVTIPPGSDAGDYQLTFKDQINSNLSTSSDWANETVKICPVTVKNVKEWLNKQSVTGLSNVAAIDEASNNQKIQISSLTLGSNGAVQIKGGAANSVTSTILGVSSQVIDSVNNEKFALFTATKTDFNYIKGDSWIRIDNSTKLSKPGVFNSNTKIYSITSDVEQYSTFKLDSSGTPVFTSVAEFKGTKVDITKQGNFVAIAESWDSPISMSLGSSVKENMYVVIRKYGTGSTVEAENAGIYRVIRSRGNGIDGYGGTFWIENADAIEQVGVTVWLKFLTEDSMVVGDTVSILNSVWGASNVGDWQVSEVGSPILQIPAQGLSSGGTTVTVAAPGHEMAVGDIFTLSPGELNYPGGTYTVTGVNPLTSFTYTSTNSYTGNSTYAHTVHSAEYQHANYFRVVRSAAGPTPFSVSPSQSLGSNTSSVHCVDGVTSKFYKKVKNIVSSIANSEGVDVLVYGGEGWSKIGEFAGSIITAMDKLNFPLDVSTGIDGYNYDVGLIQEANRVLYGDSSDPATYPGVIAAGADINILGPLIKRVKLSIQVRIQSGASVTELESVVKSTIASTVNKVGVGESISFSSILGQVELITGVVAATIVSPTYTSANDRIIVQAKEKARVVNLDTDLTVTFINE